MVIFHSYVSLPEGRIHKIFSDWWYTYPSEKYFFVSWDDDIPNIWKHKNMFQSTNQTIYSVI